MWKKILIGVSAVVVLLLVTVALQPAEFRCERSAKLPAPPSVVFAQVNNFQNWRAWSPWEPVDPGLTRTYDGPSSGVGSTYSWIGNAEVGEGRMTIIESRPSELIRIRLEFFKPFAATNLTEFTFKPEGDETLMTWTMTGTNGFCGKAMCMLMDMDQMVGSQFEQGLDNLKSVVAKAAASDSDSDEQP